MLILPIIFTSCDNKQSFSSIVNVVGNSTNEDFLYKNKLYDNSNSTKNKSTIENKTLEKLPLDGAKIGIDPGHQKEMDPGTVGIITGIPEYVLDLKVSLLLREYLIEQGATVIMTRESNDVDISSEERSEIMNENNVDLCIKIHANGFEDSSIRGASMLVPTGKISINIEKESLKAGEIIYESFLNETGSMKEGIISRDDLIGFNRSKVPVCLIEIGYMSNPEEDLLINSQSFQEKCAKGLCNGIIEWYKNK